MLYQYILLTYHSLKEINGLVAEEHLPGRAEKRPKTVTSVRIAGSLISGVGAITVSTIGAIVGGALNGAVDNC